MAQSTFGNMFEDVFQNLNKAAEANLKMQQEVFRQWTSLMPTPMPETPYIEKVREFQKEWAGTVSELARKHRDVIEKQYQASVESLDAALRVTDATNPEEYRRRTEELVRKSLDCVREISETQIKEFQDAVSKWTSLVTKTG